ncbi:hypothetical protein QDY32_004459 [Salmonella enterica]|nr:hypothetical protein [Salmonella enterica subsp. enterica serovar Oranienburg]EIX6435673.1 hypothetical protein [Salmonella enterica]EKT1614909.1 hypothetical protein [Salmonella enterica]EKT1628653.1 hypothetical protein [Salmonella enterica]ELC6656721.1 hypothetical protein [Salmonella enterica]
MSLKELKNNFERRFNICLKNTFGGQGNIKIGKNKVTIKKDESIANIDFVYLNNLNAYGTIIVVKSPVIKLDLKAFNPPYKSNLANEDYIFCMSTMGVKDGCPLLPTTENGINKTCELLVDRLKEIHLPNIINLLELDKNLVEDVINNPKCYSYPFLIVMLAMKKNNLSKIDVDRDKILNEKILGFNNDKDIKLKFNNDIFQEYSL